MSQSLSVADRRRHLDALVETYLSTLADAGIIYPADQFWFDVRRTLLFCLAYPVQCMSLDLTDPRAAELVRDMADRSSSAILEMGALELLPDARGDEITTGAHRLNWANVFESTTSVELMVSR